MCHDIHCRDNYTVNCNLAEHKLLKPEQSDSPPSRSRLYKCLAVVAAAAVVVAVVGFSIGGTAGSGVSPAARASQPAAQTSPLQGSTESSGSSADETAGDQKSASSRSRDPMAPADLNHIAAPLQSSVDAETQQVDMTETVFQLS
jgi:hypothetical protein